MTKTDLVLMLKLVHYVTNSISLYNINHWQKKLLEVRLRMCTYALVVLTSHHESPLRLCLPLYLVRSASAFHSHSGADGGLRASRLPARKVRTS